MNSEITLGDIAPSRSDFAPLPEAPGRTIHDRADCVTGCLSNRISYELYLEPVARAVRTFVLEQRRCAVEIIQHNVQITVIKEIANGSSPGALRKIKSRAEVSRYVFKSSVRQVSQ